MENKTVNRKWVIASLLAAMAGTSEANSNVGLAPSPQSLGRSEAITAAAYGGDALFYNPATLPFGRLSLRLAGVEGRAGFDESKLTQGSNDEAFTMLDYFEEMAAQNELFYEMTARALDVSMPFFAVSSFAQASMTARVADDGGSHEYLARTDMGVIAGAAVKWHKSSLGYSQYVLIRGEVFANPSLQQMVDFNAAASEDDFQLEEFPVASFTEVRYGGAIGHNIGFMQYWWKDNPSGVGIALLNAGVTHFEEKAPVEHEELTKAESELREEAARFGLEVTVPESLPQLLNIGVTLGAGGNTNDWYDVRLGIDAHDVVGKTIEHKFAASYDIGLTLPDKLALLSSFPLMNTNWLLRAAGKEPAGEGQIIHMGLLNLRAFGGVRESACYSRGAAVGFHFGVERLVSVLRLDLEVFEALPLANSDFVPQRGGRGTLGLTLIF